MGGLHIEDIVLIAEYKDMFYGFWIKYLDWKENREELFISIDSEIFIRGPYTKIFVILCQNLLLKISISS